jgi:hypothetical protein
MVAVMGVSLMPQNFLKVVHCDIGCGDCNTIENIASHCLILVDHATWYTWIHALRTLHHEPIQASFKQW